MVAHAPNATVVDVHVRRQHHSLGKVDHPNARLRVVVHEQQRAANHLVRAEELAAFECAPDGLEAMRVLGLAGWNCVEFT